MDEYAFSAECRTILNPPKGLNEGYTQLMKAVGSGRKELFCCGDEFLCVRNGKKKTCVVLEGIYETPGSLIIQSLVITNVVHVASH